MIVRLYQLLNDALLFYLNCVYNKVFTTLKPAGPVKPERDLATVAFGWNNTVQSLFTVAWLAQPL